MSIRFAPRRLGRSDVEICPIALGCFSMSHAYGMRPEAESRQVIERAIALGINLIDTADYYGWGHNERLVGASIRGRRDEVVLSSKFGYVPSDTQPMALRGDAAHVRSACEDSLRRLGTDRLDLYFQHRLDPAVPIEETVGAMADLVRAGKVRHLGLCEVSEQTLRRAAAVHPIAAVQAEYSLWTRDVEERMTGVYDELGVTLMAFSPLGRGMLTGRVRRLEDLEANDIRRHFPRFSAENFPRNVALVDRLGKLAADLGCTNSQLAIAWLLTRNPSAIAICGCDTLHYLAENAGALFVPISNEVLAELDRLFAPGNVSGDRYHPAVMQMLDR